MQYSPGFYNYVLGECDARTGKTQLAEEVRPGVTIKDFFDIVMYSKVEKKTFYLLGLNRFKKQIAALKPDYFPATTELPLSLIKFYYNRQLIVQMTSLPIKIPTARSSDNPHHVIVPLFRLPNYELQVDMLALQLKTRALNYGMKFLVVIVDTFSDYIWSYPVATTESKKVFSAFIRALSRPGKPHDFYLQLRNKIRRIVVDGGSEFKASFQENITVAFPNSELVVSTAKSKTGGRPTGNGPIEAAIGTLRRVIQDYDLSVKGNFLMQDEGKNQFGLEKILEAYNTTHQTELREGATPQMVMESTAVQDNLKKELNQKRSDKMKEKSRNGRTLRRTTGMYL
jgi:hypothetical protein